MIVSIPKNIFLVWLGEKPNYVSFVEKAYKQMNQDFDVQLVHYTLQQLEDICFNGMTKNIVDNVAYSTFNSIVKTRKYCNLKKKLLSRQQADIHFLWLFVDIFRLELINKFGGIYVDCDTFPLKQFDNKLLQLESFCVCNNKQLDNYFIGANSQNEVTDYFNTTKLMQQRHLYEDDIIESSKRKIMFFNCKLQLQKNSSYGSNCPYIEHFDNTYANNCYSCSARFNQFGSIRQTRTKFDSMHCIQIDGEIEWQICSI